MSYNFNSEININPDKTLKKSSKPKILTAQFGDGYQQRAAEGINRIDESWSLSWKNRTVTEANSILDFFEKTKGISKFEWTPPYMEDSLTVVVDTWDTSYPAPGIMSITAKFRRVFEA